MGIASHHLRTCCKSDCHFLTSAVLNSRNVNANGNLTGDVKVAREEAGGPKCMTMDGATT